MEAGFHPGGITTLGTTVSRDFTENPDWPGLRALVAFEAGFLAGDLPVAEVFGGFLPWAGAGLVLVGEGCFTTLGLLAGLFLAG